MQGQGTMQAQDQMMSAQECMRMMQEGGMMGGAMTDGAGMMNCPGCMGMMGPMGPWMMIGGGILWLLLVILAVLGIAALAKVVFQRSKGSAG